MADEPYVHVTLVLPDQPVKHHEALAFIEEVPTLAHLLAAMQRITATLVHRLADAPLGTPLWPAEEPPPGEERE